MIPGPIEELIITYDPSALEAKVDRRRRLVRGRIISLIISLVIIVVLVVWRPDWMGGAGFGVLTVVLLALPLAWLAAYVVSYRRARAELAAVGQGVALRIGRAGVEVAGLFAGWPEVAALAVVKGRLGTSPALALHLTDGRQARLPLDQVQTYPATLDTTARAYSGGRHGVDLAALES